MKLYSKHCKKCGVHFMTVNPRQKLCLICAIENEMESIKKFHTRERQEKERQKAFDK